MITVNYIKKQLIPLVRAILSPEVVFAAMLIPTKLATLSALWHLPPYFNISTVLFTILLLILIIRFLRKENFFLMSPWLTFLYTGFLLLMVFSIIYSDEPEYGKEKIKEFITVTTLACFAPCFLLIKSSALERIFLFFIAVSFLLSTFIFLSSPYIYSLYSSSPYAVFQTAIGNNYLALQYVLGTGILSIGYYFLCKPHLPSLQKIICIALIGLFAAAMLYAPGKSPILSLFLTIITITALSLKAEKGKLLMKTKILQYTLFIIVSGGLLLATVGNIFLSRMTALFTSGYYAQVERTENLKVAIDLLLHNPIIGTGIGGFAAHAIEIPGIDRMRYPHNLLLEVGAEMGFIGLFSMCGILLLTFRQLLHLNRIYRHTPYYSYSNTILALFLFSFFTSLTGGNINNPMLFGWIGVAAYLKSFLRKISM